MLTASLDSCCLSANDSPSKELSLLHRSKMNYQVLSILNVHVAHVDDSLRTMSVMSDHGAIESVH